METHHLVERFDLGPIDELLLDSNGRLKAVPASDLRQIPQVELSVWCQQRGRYTVPSLDLIHWLRERIDGREALEIGAGAGDLGHLLGIRMTDSYVQLESPDLIIYYGMLGVPPTDPPPDVEKLEALEAVKKYRPQVVIGAWITQIYRYGDEGPPPIGSSIYGIDELKIWPLVETYIHIGHKKVHKDKRLLRFKHREYRPPGVFSKQMDPTGNVVWEWSR